MHAIHLTGVEAVLVLEWVPERRLSFHVALCYLVFLASMSLALLALVRLPQDSHTRANALRRCC